MLGSWVGSLFTLYRPSSVPFCHADTNLLYVYNMSNGNQEQLFLYSTLHSLYVCKHGNMYFNWGGGGGGGGAGEGGGGTI